MVTETLIAFSPWLVMLAFAMLLYGLMWLSSWRERKRPRSEYTPHPLFWERCDLSQIPDNHVITQVRGPGWVLKGPMSKAELLRTRPPEWRDRDRWG